MIKTDSATLDLVLIIAAAVLCVVHLFQTGFRSLLGWSVACLIVLAILASSLI